MSIPMPVVFFGHGNPMNTLLDNAYTRGWAAVGSALPKPAAVLCVSAHWYVAGARVTAMAEPRTIHDFGGFPRELFEVRYPAPGSPELANRVRDLLAPIPVALDDGWGLDHGTWSVLYHALPQADVPVVQLAIDKTRPPEYHYEIGRRLAGLRDEGVLVVGSGNLVHNLHAYAWGDEAIGPYEWAARFEEQARELMLSGDDAALVRYERLGRDALLSAPTPDHYLPLLYILGTRREDDPIGFPVEGFDGGSISMLTVQVG